MDNRSKLLCGASIVIIIGICILSIGIFILSYPDSLLSKKATEVSIGSKENPSILLGKNRIEQNWESMIYIYILQARS